MQSARIRTMAQLGAFIAQARADRGLAQTALAERAGVSVPWLSQVGNGKPTADARRILDVLGANVQLTLQPQNATSPKNHPDE